MAKSSLTEQVSLFERVPDEKRIHWGNIAAILSGVVSSLSKLMGGGIVAFYAGCQLGSVAAGILFINPSFITDGIALALIALQFLLEKTVLSSSKPISPA